jgi:hypothetical protein
MERAGTALTSSNLLVTSCSSSSSNILFTLERIETHQQKADTETKSAYTSVSTGIS